jgi:hypothetical protein
MEDGNWKIETRKWKLENRNWKIENRPPNVPSATIQFNPNSEVSVGATYIL